MPIVVSCFDLYETMLLPHWCSSEPSKQSATSSHFHEIGMHWPVVHTNLCSGQRLCVAVYEILIDIDNRAPLLSPTLLLRFIFMIPIPFLPIDVNYDYPGNTKL